jgi:hypothetical protein
MVGSTLSLVVRSRSGARGAKSIMARSMLRTKRIESARAAASAVVLSSVRLTQSSLAMASAGIVLPL